jgi:hypothetical protein
VQAGAEEHQERPVDVELVRHRQRRRGSGLVFGAVCDEAFSSATKAVFMLSRRNMYR